MDVAGGKEAETRLSIYFDIRVIATRQKKKKNNERDVVAEACDQSLG